LLGGHPGPDIALPAAASLAGLPRQEVRPLVVELTRAHLVTEHVPGRYSLHDLLRAYAAELAGTHDSADDRHAALHRLLDHYLHSAQTVARMLYGPWSQLPLPPPQPGVTPEVPADHDQANAWFTAEYPALIAAVDRAAIAGLETHAWQLGWTPTFIFEARGLWREWAATQTVGLAAARRAGDPIGEAYAHQGLGRAYTWLGREHEACDHLRQALERFTALGDRAAQGNVHLGLGFLHDRNGNAREALREAEEALALFRSAGHRSGQAVALNNIGWTRIQFGEYQQALRYCREAFELNRELGEIQGQAAASDSLGLAHHHLGEHAQAITWYSAALDLYRRLEDRYDQAGTLTRLGQAHAAAGDTAAARDAWRAALRILEELRHPDAEQVRDKLGAAS